MYLLVLITLVAVTISTLGLITGSLTFNQNTRYSTEVNQAINLAEAGLDKAVASLNKTGGGYNGESEVVLDSGSFSVTITSQGSGSKIIESTGYVPNKSNPKAKRTVKVRASSGIGASFVYGIQVGEGGLQLGNNNQVTGTIYSNGSISLGNNNTITGDAWVAGGPQANADQEFPDCEGVNCTDFIFGKNVSGENHLDVAQSFKLSATNILNKISLRIKKFGNPPDVVVRIMRDENGKPDKNGVLTSGTLYNSLVSTVYGWVDVTFNSLPTLNADTDYWIMLDTSSNTNNYWSWHENLIPGYPNGVPRWSSDWQHGNAIWNSIPGGGDLSFKVYMGGTITQISGDSNNIIQGNVHANTIDTLTINREAYYQTIINSTVSGSNCNNNSNCHPGTADPPPKVFPISDGNIAQWVTEADVANLSSPVCGSQTAWGPGKYSGNFILGSNCTIIVKTPIRIIGNMTIDNSNIFRLDSSYGDGSGLILVEGKVTMGNNNKFLGTGTGSSLLMVLSTYDSRFNSETAISVGNNGNTGVFYANVGIIDPGNNNQFKELTAWGIKLTNNSIINYETGLSSTFFSSGPSGSYTINKGTYQLK